MIEHRLRIFDVIDLEANERGPGHGVVQATVTPPSKTSVWPVTKEAALEHNHRTDCAISNGSDIRPIGTDSAMASSPIFPSTGAGGGVYDGSASVPQHMLDLVFHSEPHAFQIRANDTVEICLARILYRTERSLVAGVIQRKMHSSEVLLGGPKQIFNLTLDSHIGVHEQCPGAVDRSQTLLERAAKPLLDTGKYHVSSLTEKLADNRFPDSRRAADDQRCFIVEFGDNI